VKLIERYHAEERVALMLEHIESPTEAEVLAAKREVMRELRARYGADVKVEQERTEQ